MNAKDPELIDQFIALRAARMPFAEISAKLNVSKRTLITWSQKCAQRIQSERAVEDELRAETLRVSRRACLDHIGQFHARIVEELDKRQLESVPAHRLLQMAMQLRKEAQGGGDRVTFSTLFTEADLAQGNIPKPVISWEA